MTPGEHIGKYQLLRRLGRGAMGEVWAAINADTEREVALKLITGSDPEMRRRLLREARAIGRLEHPNIVQILDRGETAAGEPFLIMQLLQGETLGERLAKVRTLPQAVAAGIALDVARALRVAHEKAIVHRDLKPANIFLAREPDTDDDVVKVVDFGVSKLSIENEGAATVNGGLLGSPAYMSPEQIRATGVDGRTDIWAVGVLLFEMIAGRRPFGDPSSVVVLGQILTQPVPRLDAVVRHADPALADVVAACLERNLERRVPSAVDLVGLLRPFVTRGRQATLVEPTERMAVMPERVASIPDAPLPSAVSDEDEDDSNSSTSVFRPSAILKAAMLSPKASATGTVLMGGPRPVASAEPPAIDESERPTTEILRGAPAAARIPPPPAARPVPPPPASSPQLDSGSWPHAPRPPTPEVSPTSGSWPRPAAFSPESGSWPRAPAAQPISDDDHPLGVTVPLMTPALPAPPPPAPPSNPYGATVRVKPCAVVPSPTASQNQNGWPASPPTSSVTAATGPLPGPARGDPPGAVPSEPQRWPFILLAISVAVLVAAAVALWFTVRETSGSAPAMPVVPPTVAPAPSITVAPTASSTATAASPPAVSSSPPAPRPGPSPKRAPFKPNPTAPF